MLFPKSIGKKSRRFHTDRVYTHRRTNICPKGMLLILWRLTKDMIRHRQFTEKPWTLNLTVRQLSGIFTNSSRTTTTCTKYNQQPNIKRHQRFIHNPKTLIISAKWLEQSPSVTTLTLCKEICSSYWRIFVQIVYFLTTPGNKWLIGYMDLNQIVLGTYLERIRTWCESRP